MPVAASAIYFLNLRGDVLINRLYRDDVGCVVPSTTPLASPSAPPVVWRGRSEAVGSISSVSSFAVAQIARGLVESREILFGRFRLANRLRGLTRCVL
ncbi:hypothetical protein E2562_026415 [Oryza meyeriana var. granulata]|uniref:Uncharacterized protein n=1 Tax=Oryza meyeriana var. granulata TaxID=110450 RepID=A0A6G1FCP0_9ORYZ|nr:hypothetical protein E2562_026415 [Oryza meyeriana var. granulata]